MNQELSDHMLRCATATKASSLAFGELLSTVKLIVERTPLQVTFLEFRAIVGEILIVNEAQIAEARALSSLLAYLVNNADPSDQL